MVVIEIDYQHGLKHRAEMFANMNVPLDATITRSPHVDAQVLGMLSTPDAGPLARRVPRVYNENI
eukprot:4705794-Lingulodinium_polyedra.AAC.1